jgi:hypothetical protein
LSVVRDDGAIVFLNGTEIFRSNMPEGAATYVTAAAVAVNGGNEAASFSTNVSPALLVEGSNVLAVEVHQQSATSSDMSFNLALTAAGFDRPALTARMAGNRVELTWPLLPTGFSLESAATFSTETVWQLETNSIAITNGENNVTFDPQPAGSRFYRLRRQQ